jgi:hypothetical protein
MNGGSKLANWLVCHYVSGCNYEVQACQSSFNWPLASIAHLLRTCVLLPFFPPRRPWPNFNMMVRHFSSETLIFACVNLWEWAHWQNEYAEKTRRAASRTNHMRTSIILHHALASSEVAAAAAAVAVTVTLYSCRTTIIIIDGCGWLVHVVAQHVFSFK